MRIRSTLARTARAAATGGVVALLVVGLTAGTVLAARGGGKPAPSGGTLALVMVVDQNQDGLPNWSDSITWQVSTTATTGPYVDVACYQAGKLVYSASAGYFDSYVWPEYKVMSLWSPSWTGGAADCTGRLYKVTSKGTTTLATTAFHVNP
jgi:hypothetical protein